MWSNLDELFKSIDQQFCSDGCKCGIKPEVQELFTKNETLKKVYELWKVENTSNVTNFMGCSESIFNKIHENFTQYEKTHGEHLKNFNLTKFGDFWEYIENKFECTGWCHSSYKATNNSEYTFYKYLASDINRGPVKYPGCLKSILDWLPPLLKAYGGIAVCCSFCGILNFLLALTLLIGCYNKDGKGNESKQKI